MTSRSPIIFIVALIFSSNSAYAESRTVDDVALNAVKDQVAAIQEFAGLDPNGELTVRLEAIRTLKEALAKATPGTAEYDTTLEKMRTKSSEFLAAKELSDVVDKNRNEPIPAWLATEIKWDDDTFKKCGDFEKEYLKGRLASTAPQTLDDDIERCRRKLAALEKAIIDVQVRLDREGEKLEKEIDEAEIALKEAEKTGDAKKKEDIEKTLTDLKNKKQQNEQRKTETRKAKKRLSLDKLLEGLGKIIAGVALLFAFNCDGEQSAQQPSEEGGGKGSACKSLGTAMIVEGIKDIGEFTEQAAKHDDAGQPAPSEQGEPPKSAETTKAEEDAKNAMNADLGDSLKKSVADLKQTGKPLDPEKGLTAIPVSDAGSLVIAQRIEGGVVTELVLLRADTGVALASVTKSKIYTTADDKDAGNISRFSRITGGHTIKSGEKGVVELRGFIGSEDNKKTDSFLLFLYPLTKEGMYPVVSTTRP